MQRCVLVISAILLLAAPLAFSANTNPAFPTTDPKIAPNPSDIAPTPPRPKRPTIGSDKTVRIVYRSPEWNLSPEKIDSGSLILRNGENGKFVQLELTETAPDSGEFAGNYALNLGGRAIVPEVYVLDQMQVREGKGIANMDSMIRAGQIQRKPIVIYNLPINGRTMEVCSRPEEALARKEIIDRELLAARMAAQPRPIIPQSTLDTAAAQQKLNERKKQEFETQAREKERQSESEKARREHEELLRQQTALATAEKAKRKAQAVEYAEAGLDYFRSNVAREAEKNFRKAYELDPENTTYFYQYGVTLYKNEKYNQALVYLQLAGGPAVPKVEKEYYIGLCHFKLKEYGLAAQSFDMVRSSGDQQLAVSGEFYRSIIYFENQDFEPAEKGFQLVEDKSDNPKMDQAAEDYIEQINKIKWYLANKAKKFFIAVSAGSEYDSNLLLQSDLSPSQTTSNKGSARALGSGGFEYRPLFTDQHEFSVKLAVDTQYTFESDLASADALSYLAGPVYKYKGTLFGKGYKLEVNSNYEIIYNDPATSGTKKVILTSIPVSVANTFIMSETWFLNFGIIYSLDSSKLDATTPADNASATKWIFDLNNILFENKKRVAGWLTDLKYTMNNANGDNFTYTKIEPYVGYMMPIFWDMSFVPKITYYTLNYPKRVPVRTDTDYKLETTFNKPILDWLSASMEASYTINNSTTPESYQYKKFDIIILLNASYSF